MGTGLLESLTYSPVSPQKGLKLYALIPQPHRESDCWYSLDGELERPLSVDACDKAQKPALNQYPLVYSHFLYFLI